MGGSRGGGGAEGGDAATGAPGVEYLSESDVGDDRRVGADDSNVRAAARAGISCGARKMRKARRRRAGGGATGPKARDVFGHELLVQCPVPARRRDARCVRDIAGRWRSLAVYRGEQALCELDDLPRCRLVGEGGRAAALRKKGKDGSN